MTLHLENLRRKVLNVQKSPQWGSEVLNVQKLPQWGSEFLNAQNYHSGYLKSKMCKKTPQRGSKAYIH